MNRPQQVTRSMTVAAQAPEPRDLSAPRAWSAMLMSDTSVVIASGNLADLPTNVPRHATNGDSDFDMAAYPVVKLIIPWDGIYAINARSSVFPLATATGGAQMIVTTSAGDVDPGRALVSIDASSIVHGLETTRVGFPMTAGTRVWAWGGNYTDQSASYEIDHLEATYLCPLGTVYPIGGGAT